MDVSSIATAYTAFSEVLVGFAWGTESPQRCSAQTCRGRSAWLRSLPQNQAVACTCGRAGRGRSRHGDWPVQ